MNRNIQQGFTLIELIMVIVILGILAATALPKFADLSGDARKSTLKGIQGALNSSVVVAKSAFLVKGTGTSPITLADGTTVIVGTTGAAAGVPTGAAGGIGAMLSLSSQDITPDYATTSGSAIYQLKANCKVTYDGATGTSTILDTGC